MALEPLGHAAYGMRLQDWSVQIWMVDPHVPGVVGDPEVQGSEAIQVGTFALQSFGLVPVLSQPWVTGPDLA